MDSREIRKQNLIGLVSGFGSVKMFAEFADMDPSHVSQLTNGFKNIGHNVARKIEAKFEKPTGWMDVWDGNQVETELYKAGALRSKLRVADPPTTIGIVTYELDQKRLEEAIELLDDDVENWCTKPTVNRARLLMMYYDQAAKNKKG